MFKQRAVSFVSHLRDLGNIPLSFAFCLLRRTSSSGCLSMLASGGLTGGDIGGDSDEKLFCRFDLSPLRSRWPPWWLLRCPPLRR